MAKKPLSLVTLYHFTGAVHIGSIRTDGFLRTTESNLSRTQSRPDHVVWLTSSAEWSEQGGLRGGRRISGRSTADKREFRITVELPIADTHHWVGWAKRHRIARDWLATLMNTAGSNPHGFWVVERAVPKSEWRAVDRWNGTAWEPYDLDSSRES